MPSIETFNNICNKKYRHIQIFKRFENYPLPNTKIVNLNINKNKKNFIADETINLVKKFLEKGDKFYFL